MKFVTEFKGYDRRNKTKWVISMLGMVITGGLAIYFLIQSLTPLSYQLVLISYISFIAMCLFYKIPVGKTKQASNNLIDEQLKEVSQSSPT